MAKEIERKSAKQKKQEYADSQQAYFEAILQLRGHTEKQFNKIVDQIEQSNCKINKHIFVNKNDIDLYLTSQKYIMQLERWIKEQFNNVNITFSRTLHTRDTRRGKDLYRITLCVRFLKYGIGDVVEYKGDKIKITTMGQKPSGKLITTGKRTFIDPRDLL
jgi:NMD protein affecting ribosome stability and mRNA decay